MAEFDDEDELDKEDSEPSKEESDIETDIPSEKEVKAEGQPSPSKEDKDTDEELEDSEVTAEDEAQKKELPQEIKDESEKTLKDIPSEDKTDDEAEMKEASPANQKLDRYQNFIDEYKKLQDQRKRTDLASGLAAAGAQVGQAIAGKYSGQFVPDQSGSQAIKQIGERPVQDFEQNQVVQGRGMQLQSEMSATDPASPQSRLTRDYLKTRLGIALPETVSAADAQILLKTIGRPIQTKFQKVNGTYPDPQTGQSKRISAIFDPGTGTYKDAESGAPLKGFLAEGLNPYQMVKGEHGEQQVFNKSQGITPKTVNASLDFSKAQSPSEVYTGMHPDERKEMVNKIIPAFNKETEKTQQRLTHVPVILQRLQEAQTNPAALPQLKAELVRFDVGDQRLAVQEFDMFAKRMGYKGWEDWMAAHTTGTITPDFANGMAQAVTHVSEDLKEQLSDAAEKQAKIIMSRMPKNQQPDIKNVAPLIYGNYKPSSSRAPASNEEIRLTKDGRKAVFNPKTKEFIRWAE